MSGPQFDWHYSRAEPEPVRAGPPQIGPYTIRGELARGGMGVVYLGWDPQLGREVAIKTLLEPDERRRERFRREAESLARLRHPGVVPVHAVDEHELGPYLVMKLIQGRDLQTRINEDGPLPPAEAAALVATLARALQHAHEQRILHRDVKPSNVILTDEGPVLTDFGLARSTAGEAQRLTQTGTMLGTPGYMSPEQAGGSQDAVDARTDVYGLGGTLYAALTGEPPFQGGSLLELVVATHESQVVPVRELRPEVPQRLDAICLRALNKAPRDRQPSAAALAEELEAFLAGGARGAPILAAAALIAAAVVVTLIGLLTSRSAPVGAPPEDVAAAAPAGRDPAPEPPEDVNAPPGDPVEAGDGPRRVLSHASARAAEFSLGGDGAVVIGDTRASFWDLRTGARVSLQEHSMLEDLCVDPQGRRAAYGGAGNTVWIADARTGAAVASILVRSYLYALAWSPDGERLAAGGRTGEVFLIHPGTERVVQTIPHPHEQIMELEFSPDGRWLAVASEPLKTQTVRELSSVLLYRRTSQGYVSAGRREVRSKPGVLAWDPSSTQLVVGDRGGFLSAYTVQRFTDAEPVQFSDPEIGHAFVLAQAHPGRVHHALFLDAEQVISVSERSRHAQQAGCLKRWDRAGKLLEVHLRGRGGYHWVDVSPDGRTVLLTQNHGDAVEVWNLEQVLR